MIQVKRTTSQVRKASNVALAEGQPLYETDTKLLFFGDGVTPAKSLSPAKVYDTDFAKLSSPNQFTETNTFAEIEAYGLTVSNNLTLSESINSFNVGANKINLPNKAGTLALMDDVTDAISTALGNIETQLAQIDTGTGV